MRNVVVLCYDSVRKDFYDLYAPRVRALSDVSMDECRAASSWTVPSHGSMVTGDLPHEHGVHTHDRNYASIPVEETLFAAMPDHRRIGISSNVFASEAFQFDRFFDEFETVTEARRFPRGVDPVDYISPDDGGLVRNQLRLLADSARHDQPLRSGANAALAYADSLSRRLPVPRLFDGGTKPLLRSARQKVRRTDGPFFLFVNFMESHLPLEPTAGYDESLYSAPDTFSTGDRSVWELLGSAEEYPEYLRRRRGLYGASIDYLDRHVSEFIADLREETDRETTVVVTADHGENLGYPGDGGLVRHKSSLSEGLLHVPCDIVNPPDGAAPPTGRFTSHLDFDTLLPALGRGEFPDIGREAVPAELVGLSAGPNPDPEHEHWDRMIRTVLHGDQKEIRDSTGRTVRCDLDPDRPSWQGPPTDIDSVSPVWSQFFDGDLCEYKRRASGDEDAAAVSASVEQRLAELGYQ
ncbi:sulfatase-like hydrolase/transferase [Halosimplex aquaticum]|uniref:Sulfatase-like hydrolase/transferase n=1 Tax=Halosimplex aquaticum TaxID=3026162 RepID=A0ABD5XV98_9EURY|nr:sulfatase-like hydrolase/transferase [Halosimplex aquaticum]